MDMLLTDLSNGSLSVAVKANLYAFFRLLGRSPEAEFSEQDGLARWRTPVPHFWFNGVLCARPPRADESATVQERNMDRQDTQDDHILCILCIHVPLG